MVVKKLKGGWMRLKALFCLFIPRKNLSFFSVVNVTITSGHRGARASAESSASGPVKPNSTEDGLAGEVAPPPEASDEMNLDEKRLLPLCRRPRDLGLHPG